MTKVVEIIGYTKRVRGEIGRRRIDFWGIDKAGIGGSCGSVVRITDQFNGQDWQSDKAKGRPNQACPGHALGVIGTRGKAGVVVDFTGENGPIVGQVEDVTNQREVQRVLREITGVDDWYRKKKLTAKELRDEYGL